MRAHFYYYVLLVSNPFGGKLKKVNLAMFDNDDNTGDSSDGKKVTTTENTTSSTTSTGTTRVKRNRWGPAVGSQPTAASVTSTPAPAPAAVPTHTHTHTSTSNVLHAASAASISAQPSTEVAQAKVSPLPSYFPGTDAVCSVVVLLTMMYVGYQWPVQCPKLTPPWYLS